MVRRMEQRDPTLPVRLALGGMLGMTAGMGVGRFFYTPVLPAMMAELGLSAADAGWIASANYLGYLVGALLAAGGWAAGHERLVMLASLALNTVLLAMMSFSDSVGAFLIIRFFAGGASAFMMVFLASIVFSHLAQAGRNDLQGLHFSGVGVGIVSSSLIMTAIVQLQQPWHVGWRWAAVLSAIATLGVAWAVRIGPAAHGPDRIEPQLPRHGPLMKLILSYGFFGFGYIVTATFLIAIVRDHGGTRLFEGVVWMATGLAILPSLWIWGFLARQRGPAAVLIAGCLVEAVGVAASVSVGGWVGPILAGLLLGGTFVAVTAYGLQAARALAPASPRRSFALMTAAFGVGQILGPIAAGLIAQRSGGFFGGSMLAAVALVIAALLAAPAAKVTRPA